MRSKDVLKILNVTRVTLTTYVKTGKIKVTKLANGYYDYDDKSIYDFIGHNKKINIIYTRVSTNKQKYDLQRQIDYLNKYCSKNNIIVGKTYSEISSGIDLDRNEFSSMLDDIFKYKVDKIIITDKDRLTRLSFITLENIFKQFGTSIVVASSKKNNDNNELFDELISIMHLFSTKEYSRRKNKKI
ncbi:putative site-specific integrase-resolvase [Bodo saltans virus]|uniref:Site-specific integrase-resolvase n=1 Tax=Bodo saltans virus TaxID=2024608 RepID=A0A2H4UVP3_9VIRU|nr:putative site-specific integrase-resolvase [Bodo saltans virus]ATZ80992.1 putative site-specific integrase-resolvase [Bodo saltans virus]